MSFSKSVKEELSKISNLSNKEIVKAELMGYLITTNIIIKNNKIKCSTESEYNINRFSKLLSNINISKYNIDIQGKVFNININETIDIKEVENDEGVIHLTQAGKEFIGMELLEKAIVRGSFLGGGFVNNPEKSYHLEIIYSDIINRNYIENILNKNNINVKTLNNSIYIKDGEEISKFFAFIGASTAVLRFEEIRVIRDMRNNVNRIVNCETANINKTINASLKQIEDIKYIIKSNKIHELSESLQEMANVRLENPEMSLVELGKMLKNPLGKSGVNYRLKLISEYAEELRKQGEEKWKIWGFIFIFLFAQKNVSIVILFLLMIWMI